VRGAGWILAGFGLAGLFWLVWRGAMAAPAGHLFGMPGPMEEASYCLAVAERGAELTQGRADPRIEAHLDEQILFWRLRTGGRFAAGRAALARDTSGPGSDEGAWLHLALQDCGHRAIALYGHRFPSLE
jgi:hypothetical protein